MRRLSHLGLPSKGVDNLGVATGIGLAKPATPYATRRIMLLSSPALQSEWLT
jgi:hypothetical protein